ncbi:MAG: adenylate cyclase [Novosphingobium sp.]
MATQVNRSRSYRDDQSFFVKLASVLVVLILFGFVQWALRGMVSFGAEPVWVHLHGLLMVSFLGIFIAQNRSAASGNLVQHRRLGRIAAFAVAAIVGLGCFTGIMSLRHHTFPEFFSAAYFLVLTLVEPVVFGGLVYAAILRRKETEYHRRLMMGAVIVLMEPALGRLLPAPFMHGLSEWAVLVIQLMVIVCMAMHDRKVIGRIHPATAAAGAVVALTHVVIELSAINPAIQSLAARIAG